MTNFTDYNNYELPEPFEVNERNEWGYILNDALDQLDDDIIRQTSGVPPNTLAETGRLYLDTNDLTLYRGTSGSGSNVGSWKRFGAQLTVQESLSTKVGNPTTLNFDRGFVVTNPSSRAGKVDIADIFIENSGDTMEGVLDMGSNDLVDGTTTIWNSAGEFLEQTSLENDSVTVVAGDGLKNGGAVALGSSTTLDIEPVDFAGTFLSDDGTDNLTVNLGSGVEGDGAGNIRLDEDFSATWTTEQTFSGGIGGLPAPTADNDAARKQYVDGVAQGLDLKESTSAATSSNIDLTSTADPNPIDGYTLSNGERVLLKNQTTASENGIYVANTATDPSTWTRSTDFDEDAEVTSGSFTFVENGTTNGNTSWIVTTDDPITVGTTAIVWSQFASAGEITAGVGLSKTGQTLDVNFGTGVEANADNVRLDEDYAASWTTNQTFGADILDGLGNAIYDQTNNWVPQTRLENDSVTVTAGNQLTGGGTVALGGSVTVGLNEGSGSGLDADTVDGFESAELRASNNVAQLSSTNTSLNINQSTWTSIPFNAQLKLDAAYTHDASASPETVTFDEGGTYRIEVSLSYDSNGNTNVNPGIKFNVNGTRLDTFGLTGETSAANGATEGSNTVARIIDVNAGDTLEVQTLEMGNTGTVTMRSNESVLFIEQLSASTAFSGDADTLDGLDSTAFVKTDGSTPITSAQAINQTEGNDYLKLNNTTTGDTWDFHVATDASLDLEVNNTDVMSVDAVSQQTTFTSRVFGQSGFDAGGSSIDNSTEVNTTGSGTASFDVYDSANAQDIARFNEGGNVDIPSGGLDVSGVTVLGSGVVVQGNFNIDNNQITNVGAINAGSSPMNFYTEGHPISIYDTTNSQYILQALEGGNVDIPNGDLNASGSIIDTNPVDLSGGFIETALGGGGATLWRSTDSTAPTIVWRRNPGDEAFDIYDDTNSNHLLRAYANGRVDIPNGSLRLATGQNIEDGNGNPVLGVRSNHAHLTHGQASGDSRTLLYDITGTFAAVNYATSSSTPGTLELTNADLTIGGTSDFRFSHDTTNDELVISDDNGIELIRQPKAGSTQFLQGIDAGSIEAPEDSFSQLVNTSVTSSAVAGDRVGYTFALDNQTALAIDGEADGSGGIQNTDVRIPNHSLDMSNNRVTNVERVGGNGFFFDFNNSSSWVELINSSGSREQLVTEDVYINQRGNWIGDDGVFAPTEGGYEIQKNGTDGAGIINFKT